MRNSPCWYLQNIKLLAKKNWDVPFETSPQIEVFLSTCPCPDKNFIFINKTQIVLHKSENCECMFSLIWSFIYSNNSWQWVQMFQTFIEIQKSICNAEKMKSSTLPKNNCVNLSIVPSEPPKKCLIYQLLLPS